MIELIDLKNVKIFDSTVQNCIPLITNGSSNKKLLFQI